MAGFSLDSSQAGNDQFMITAAFNTDQSSAASTFKEMYRKLDSLVGEQNMRILNERVFGELEFFEHFSTIRKGNCSFGFNPFSYVEGKPCRGKGLAGVQIHAVRPDAPENCRTIYDNNLPCGQVWSRKNTTYVHLTGITATEHGPADHKEQAGLMFDKINRLLNSQNVGYRKVVRTWIYLANILEWYDEFNLIRNDKYKEYKLIPETTGEAEMDHLYLPASTGIGARNRTGASVISDVLAIDGDTQISVLPGISQHSPYRYGSAFSRGICIRESDHRQLLVSGTASIAERGSSQHPNNIEAQVTRTLECVDSLLKENCAKLTDIQSATVFFKRPGDFSVFDRIAGSFGLKNLPAVFVAADICREELLFEMDALAVCGK